MVATMASMAMSGSRVPRVVLVALLLAGWTSQNAGRIPRSSPQLALKPCVIAGAEDRALCGTYEVFENRTTNAGRKIGLRVVVLPATNRTRAGEPVFWLDGGPGGAATGAIGPVANQYLRGVRDDHDLVFVDTRGTGDSGPLRCDDIGERPANLDAYYGPLFPIDAIRACRDRLSPIADLTQYTTSLAMDDIDDVRAALGYQKIHLFGSSYGTIAAQVYLRRHPDRVKSAFLTGVAATDFRLPLPFARAAQTAWELTAADCEADSVCRSAFPGLRREFAAVLARFDRGPLRVTMTDPVTGQPRTVALEREAYVERLRALLYSTHGARFVPLVVHRAFQNDFLALQVMAARFNLGGPALARGLYFSITCAESAPFITEQDIVKETRGTFLGDRRVRAHLAVCESWPKGQVPRSFLAPVRSDVPVVLFSGDADGSTPPWVADAIAQYFSNGVKVRASRSGHQIDACASQLMQAFMKNPDVRQLDVGCASGLRRPPFATELPK
jgi:pimeloyl-ACP methyl ester carboxylesterase